MVFVMVKWYVMMTGIRLHDLTVVVGCFQYRWRDVGSHITGR